MSHGQSVRAALEQREAALSPFAARSSRSRGREQPEQPSPVRLEFQRDRDRIIHCKSFRRLKHKTQVFVAPADDHYVTRLTHTLEVAQIGRTIARALNLNEDLTEAIALGHDLGHTPFGHRGEEALAELLPNGFSHNEQSLRVVERLERGGKGLNLTWEVRDGILHHSKSRESVMSSESGLPATLEGEIARIADSVAYLNHDIADAIRAGLLTDGDLPANVRRTLGDRHSQRIDTLVSDIVDTSWPATGLLGTDVAPVVAMSPQVLAATDELRDFMFEHVYLWEDAQPEAASARRLVRFLFEHYVAHPDEIVSDFALPDDPPWRRSADYIAGMTDTFALALGHRLGFQTQAFSS
jgi:dGTPase